MFYTSKGLKIRLDLGFITKHVAPEIDVATLCTGVEYSMIMSGATTFFALAALLIFQNSNSANFIGNYAIFFWGLFVYLYGAFERYIKPGILKITLLNALSFLYAISPWFLRYGILIILCVITNNYLLFACFYAGKFIGVLLFWIINHIIMRKIKAEIIISTFVNSVYLYDDRLIVTYNYKEGDSLKKLEVKDLKKFGFDGERLTITILSELFLFVVMRKLPRV